MCGDREAITIRGQNGKAAGSRQQAALKPTSTVVSKKTALNIRAI
jgi:hypothetical protein